MTSQDKTVIVTGAAGGLGKAIATAFLDSGANVVICDVNLDRIAAVEAEWAKSYAGKFLATQTNVTDESAVQSLIDTAVSKFGRLDVLVNNAGIMDDFSPVGVCPKDMWDRVLAVNLNGPYLTTKAAVNQFEKQEPAGGIIINIASNAGIYGFKAGVAYTVSKTGLIGLTKNTAGFYGPKGTYCMALVIGGMINTNIADAMAGGMHMEMFQQIMMTQRQMEPGKTDTPLEGIAKYCLFLSDRDIAATSNGGCIVFNKNWPEA